MHHRSLVLFELLYINLWALSLVSCVSSSLPIIPTIVYSFGSLSTYVYFLLFLPLLEPITPMIPIININPMQNHGKTGYLKPKLFKATIIIS